MDWNELLNQAGDRITEAGQLIENISLAEDIDFGGNESIGGSDKITEVLEAGSGSKQSSNLKKILAAAAIAKEQAQGTAASIDATALAANIDNAATRVHAAYDVATGKKTAEEAVENILDRAAVYVVHISEEAIDKLTGTSKTLANVVVDKGLDRVVDIIGNAIAKKFPPARLAIPIVKTVVNAAKPAIRKVLHTGIDVLAGTAKTTIKSTISQAKSVITKVSKKAISKIFS